jgi:hypothetical protein
MQTYFGVFYLFTCFRSLFKQGNRLLARLSKCKLTTIRSRSNPQADVILGIDEKKPRWWIVGCLDEGKSTTLFVFLNSPVFDDKGLKWVHASKTTYSVVLLWLKTKGCASYYGTFAAKTWRRLM